MYCVIETRPLFGLDRALEIVHDTVYMHPTIYFVAIGLHYFVQMAPQTLQISGSE